MAIAYDKYINDILTSINFFIRRLFRIWPLLWLAVVLVAVPAYISGKPYSGVMIALNLSTLFGFVAPTEYINMGAWSIGNEMVYYAFTPVFIAGFHWRRLVGNLMTLLTMGIALIFAFYLLDSASPLEAQWGLYINPFNNLFLYSSGLAIYYNFRAVEVPHGWRLPLLVMVIALFFVYPSSGDQINIVTGINRVAMSLIALAIVLAFYKCAPVLPNILGDKLEKLGVATYGVYLLHPIVMSVTRGAFQALGLQIKYLPVLLAIGLTIALALFTFRFFESPLIKLGKRVTHRDVASADRQKQAAPVAID